MSTFVQRSVLVQLRGGPSTAEALSATLNVDLALVAAVLRGLLAIGRVEQSGCLWQLSQPPRRAA